MILEGRGRILLKIPHISVFSVSMCSKFCYTLQLFISPSFKRIIISTCSYITMYSCKHLCPTDFGFVHCFALHHFAYKQTSKQKLQEPLCISAKCLSFFPCFENSVAHLGIVLQPESQN